MPTVNLISVTSTEDSSLATAINRNMSLIEVAFRDLLSRSVSAGNSMEIDLDMNSQKIVNLGAPVANADAVRLIDISSYLTNAQAAQTAAEAAQTAAETAQTAAETAQTNAETAQTAAEAALDSFDDIWLGVKASEPTVDNDGDALTEGDLYYNSVTNDLWTYESGDWVSITGVTASSTTTFTNKTIDWTDNTMALTSAELAAALSDETGSGLAVFATSPVLTTPQINDTSSDHQYIFAASELAADRTVTLPLLTGNDTFVFEAFAATLTNKTVDLTDNTLTGTKAQFDTAVSDGNIAYDGGAHHDGFSDFVANEHIDHTSVTLTAGAGLTGGGTIAASRTFDIGAGTGITVNADDVAISLGSSLTWTATQSFQDQINVGEDDVDPGLVIVYGGAATEEGGEVRLHNAADHDTTNDYFYIEASSGGSADAHMGWSATGPMMVWAADSLNVRFVGDLQVGTNDDDLGLIELFGGGDTEQGGELRLYNPNDHDTTNEYARFFITDAGHVQLDWVTTGTIFWAQADATAINFPGVVYVGTDDDDHGFVVIRGGGTGETGGEIQLYNDADNDGTDEYWYLRMASAAFEIQGVSSGKVFGLTAGGELQVGFSETEYNAGTKSSGTYTPDPTNGNIQYATNNGAHTLAPATNASSIVILYTNGASAGTITTSGFTSVSGDSFTTTNGDEFMCYLTTVNNGTSFEHLHVEALQ